MKGHTSLPLPSPLHRLLKLLLPAVLFLVTALPSPAQEHIPAWDTVYNLIEGSDWLQKGAVSQSWTNNLALSEDVLKPYEDGYIAFKIDALFDRYKVCLATVDSSGNIAEKYTLRMEDVKVKVYVDQQWQATYNNYQVGGIYTIERAGDKVYFRKGSSAFRTITVDRDLELRAYVVIANQWVKIRRFRSTFPATIYDLPDTAYAVTWIGLSNAQHDGNGGLTKLDTSEIAGAYSLNMLGPGESGFMKWSVQELSEDKIVGFSATGAGGFDTTAFKYGVLFHSDNSFEVYSHGTGTGSTGTVLIDDLFKLSRQGNYYYAYRNGQKIDSTAADTSHVLNSRVALGSAGAGAGAMQHSNPALVHNEDLFALEIMYNQVGQSIVDDLDADSLFNGNIAALKWQTSDGTWRTDPRAYAYRYDPLNRLVASKFAIKDVENNDYNWPTPLTNGDIFNVNLAYDLNGNIESLVRYGLVYYSLNTSPPVLYGPIDSLTYVYNGNQVAAIDDDGQDSLMTSTPNTFYNNNHFLDRGSKGVAGSFKEYEYDKNGNLITDDNKKIDIAYNHLNLPQSVVWANGQRIDWVYSAGGEKLQKIVKDSLGAIIYTKSYIGNYEYADTSLEAIYFSEGRATPGEGQAFSFEYTITDHLGNGRVWWRWDEATNKPQVLQRADYYPFGLEHAQPGTVQIGVVNNYRYNSIAHAPGSRNKEATKEEQINPDKGLGMEFVPDYRLDVYHSRFRTLDPVIGRWWLADPATEAFYGLSAYGAMLNNPIAFNDPDGDCPPWVCGAVAGAGLDYTIQVGINRLEGKSWSESFTHINEKQLAVATLTGAAGAGLLSKVKQLKHLRNVQNAIRASDEVVVDVVNVAEDIVTVGTGVLDDAAKTSTQVVEQVAVHGNSLKSLRPTWGYKLYSQEGTFLKNGITSKLVPESRYTKAFMSDKYMVPVKQFPNRLDAWKWEFQQNQILRGPLNKNMH